MPGYCPSMVTSPVHGDLPITLNRNRHPVQGSRVVRRIDATKLHHAAALIISMESGGEKAGFHLFIHSFTYSTEHINCGHSKSYS